MFQHFKVCLTGKRLCVEGCFSDEIAHHQEKKKKKKKVKYDCPSVGEIRVLICWKKNGFWRELFDVQGFDSDWESSPETGKNSGLNNKSFFFS